MPLFYVSTSRGCGIRTARDEEHAESMVEREIGSMEYIEDVHEATERDIAWVQGMGGKVPKDRYGS